MFLVYDNGKNKTKFTEPHLQLRKTLNNSVLSQCYSCDCLKKNPKELESFAQWFVYIKKHVNVKIIN